MIDLEVNSAITAAATGHTILAERMDQFSKTWTKKREQMTTNVSDIQHIITLIEESFTSLDHDLANAITNETTPTGPTRMALG
jgi:hypothetical protein